MILRADWHLFPQEMKQVPSTDRKQLLEEAVLPRSHLEIFEYN